MTVEEAIDALRTLDAEARPGQFDGDPAGLERAKAIAFTAVATLAQAARTAQEAQDLVRRVNAPREFRATVAPKGFRRGTAGPA